LFESHPNPNLHLLSPSHISSRPPTLKRKIQVVLLIKKNVEISEVGYPAIFGILDPFFLALSLPHIPKMNSIVAKGAIEKISFVME